MRSSVFGFVCGVFMLQQQPGLMRGPALITLMLLATLLALLSCRFQPPFWRGMARVTSAALIGWSWASILATQGLAHRLTADLEEQEIAVVGVVTSLPVQADFGQRFQFQLERVISPGMRAYQLPNKILLAWYDNNAQLLPAPEAPLAVRPGERWQLKVRLRRPHGLANPHGFDSELWMLERGIDATGTVIQDKPGQGSERVRNQRLNEFVFSINNVIERARGALRTKIMTALHDQPYASIIVALVIGDQSSIPQTDWAVISKTGISHLVAISGLHISMVSGMAALVVFYLWRHAIFSRYALPILLPAQKAAALFGVLTALLYVALAGFGIPAQRALIMIAVVAASLWLNRKIGVSHILFFALGAVVLVDPWAVLSAGFWLSFCAVACIFYATQGRHDVLSARTDNGKLGQPTNSDRLHRFRQAVTSQYAITLGMLPLTLLLFNQISVVSPIANAVAIPLVSLVIMPLAFVASVLPDPISGWLFIASHQLLVWLFAGLTWLSGWSWAIWRAPRPELWMFACAMIGTAWCLAPRGWPMRWAGLIAWLPIGMNVSVYPVSGALNLTVIDIGQGMAMLIETAHHRMLYDTGPAYSPTSNAGSRIIYPYLTMRGIDHLDGMMISHNDNDHSGGALSLLEQVPVDWVSTSLDMQSKVVQISDEKSHHVRCVAGQEWDWDGVHFELLHPVPAVYESEKWKSNARSCTLKITNGMHTVLLAGDIEATQEDELANSVAEKLNSTVLLVPHHGSGTSSTSEFLAAVQPKIALFQLGYHNRYHHPKAEVWQRYADLGSTRLRTDRDGAITINVADEVQFETYRQSHARYWYPTDAVD